MTGKRTILITASIVALFLTQNICAQDFFIHTVTRGQGLYSISRIYRVSEDDIIRLNPGSEKTIRIGQQLRIPYADGSVPKQEAPDQVQTEARVESAQSDETNAAAKPDAGQNDGYRTSIEIRKRITIYRICNDYGISEEDFLEANPQYRTTRLRIGDIVNIPYTSAERETMEQNRAKAQEVQSQEIMVQAAAEHVHMPNSVNAVMLLPLMLDDTLSTDRPKMIEFTRGTLMAVERLKDEGISVNLKIIDSGTDILSLDKATANGELDNADVVFGLKYNAQIERMAEWSTTNQVPLVLPFNADDRHVYDNPCVYQLNTPQSYFHQEIYDHFMQQFPNPNIIILDDGEMKRNDMLKGLKDLAGEHGFPTVTIPADTGAVLSILENLDAERQNVFIINNPEEGPLITMLPILQIVNRTKDGNIATCLFGYPEYQIYASKHLDEMCECNTWFYSWFFTNNTLKEAADFGLDFIRSFNRQMMVSYPSYAPYGYDTGYYFMKGIALYGKDFGKHLDSIMEQSVQMGFKFRKISRTGGYVNHKVFFIHFSPEYEVEKIDFDK